MEDILIHIGLWDLG